MENKTAMTFLIEKILRMPESNIKTFLNISGHAYLELEKEQIKRAFVNYFYNDDLPLNDKRALHKIAEDYYNKTYGTGH